MSICMPDTFCSFTRNIIFKSCFLFSRSGHFAGGGEVRSKVAFLAESLGTIVDSVVCTQCCSNTHEIFSGVHSTPGFLFYYYFFFCRGYAACMECQHMYVIWRRINRFCRECWKGSNFDCWRASPLEHPLFMLVSNPSQEIVRRCMSVRSGRSNHNGGVQVVCNTLSGCQGQPRKVIRQANFRACRLTTAAATAAGNGSINVNPHPLRIPITHPSWCGAPRRHMFCIGMSLNWL